jgi:hypothetical protein
MLYVLDGWPPFFSLLVICISKVHIFINLYEIKPTLSKYNERQNIIKNFPLFSLSIPIMPYSLYSHYSFLSILFNLILHHLLYTVHKTSKLGSYF